MAANLTGMFAQLNNAIKGAPSHTGLLDLVSQGAGNLMAGPSGVDPYKFMNEGARKLEGRDQLGGLDLTTSQGMKEAATIYQKLGDSETAMKFAQGAMALEQKQVQNMEAQGAAMTQEAQRKRALADATMSGDEEMKGALKAGIITPQEYFKNKMAVRTARATQDPYKGAFTQEVQTNSGPIQMRFNAAGQPIAILGAGKKDAALTEAVNPATGKLERAVVDKQNPEKAPTFVGQSSIADPKISIQKNAQTDGRYDVFVDGELVRTVDSIDQGKEFEKNMNEVYKSGLVRNTIDEASKIVSTYGQDWDGVGGYAGYLQHLPGTQARELETLVNSIRSNLGFTELRKLREAGGTLGQVSNIENLLLQSTIASLDTLNSPEALQRAFDKIDSHLLNMQKLALGESVVQTIDWSAPGYQDLGVQVAQDADGSQVVRLPNGEILR